MKTENLEKRPFSVSWDSRSNLYQFRLSLEAPSRQRVQHSQRSKVEERDVLDTSGLTKRRRKGYQSRSGLLEYIHFRLALVSMRGSVESRITILCINESDKVLRGATTWGQSWNVLWRDRSFHGAAAG